MGRKQITPKLKFNIKLKGDIWVVMLYTKSSFIKLYKNNLGICEYSHKQNDLSISFRGPNVSKDTIAHELMHAYLSYRDFSKNSSHTIEERVCEDIGRYYGKIYLITEKLYAKLNRKKNEAPFVQRFSFFNLRNCNVMRVFTFFLSYLYKWQKSIKNSKK